MTSRSVLTITLLLTMACCVTKPVQAQVNPLDGLEQVGTSSFRWMLWRVYDGTLFSPDGEYDGLEPGIALQLRYRRSIDADRLIQATRDQWQAAGLYREDPAEAWLASLSELWPDVSPGDRITVRVTEGLEADFYLNDRLLGRLEDSAFTGQFLAIWLGENSSDPRQRDELIGAR